jgi:ribonuclease VapC
MFMDASAMIAILAGEEGFEPLAEAIDAAAAVYASPLSMYEAAVGLARTSLIPIPAAAERVQRFLTEIGAETIDMNAEIGMAAINAFVRFGKGRHRAGLNMGDCFAYACAQNLGVPLLCKGDDFARTDIALALGRSPMGLAEARPKWKGQRRPKRKR